MLTLFRLSVAFGVPARQLADDLTADDLLGYQAYYALEPFGSKADDVRAALVAHTSHASMGGKSPFKSFVPVWDVPKPQPYARFTEVFGVWAKDHKRRH